MSHWKELAQRVLKGAHLTDEESLQILTCSDEELLDLLHSAYLIRYHYFKNKVKLNMIMNTKSGLCPENCGYCSQSSVSKAPIEKYAMLDKEAIIKRAEHAHSLKAGTVCIVASGRGPSNKEVDRVASAVKEIKENLNLKVCACLGILNDDQTKKLKTAGVDRYNHNLNTSEDHHDAITTSHTYQDRVNTVEMIKHHDISPCSGVIIGMKETHKDVIEMAKSLKALDVDSIPVNFLHAIDGTPLEGTDELNPRYCLKVLCFMRFMNPTKEIRISGGREVNLRSLQPLGLYPANSIFVGDYLTTAGQQENADHQMLKDLGFEIDFTPKEEIYN